MSSENNYWKRTSQISRRRLLGGAGVAGLGAAGLALVGCGDDDKGSGTSKTPGTTAASGTPAGTPVPTNREGLWRSHYTVAMPTLNSWDQLNLSVWGMSIPCYDHLFAVNQLVGETELFLAASLEIQDPTSFVVKIKPAVWQNKAPVNGRAVTAEDLQKTFMGIRKNPKMTNKDAWWDNTLEKVDVIDDKTIKVTLTKPDAWTFSTNKFASSWTSSILPREHATDPSLMNSDIIGSGMYEYVSFEAGTRLKAKRSETYRVKGEPNLAGIDARLIQEPAAALAAFSAKELDVYGAQNKLEKDQLVQKHGADVRIAEALSNAVWTLVTRGDGQWADPRVQQAFSMALDRKEMIELIHFGAGKVSGIVPPGHGAWALTEKEVADTYGKFDPAAARKLLAATTFDMSKEYGLKFYTGVANYTSWCEILQSQLQKNLGVKIKLIGEDFGTWINKSLLASNYELLSYPSIAYDSPIGFLGGMDALGVPNWTAFKNDELTATLRKMESNYDTKSRQQQARDMQKRAWELGNPYIPTFVGTNYTAYQKWVKGTMAGTGSYQFLVGSTWIEKH